MPLGAVELSRDYRSQVRNKVLDSSLSHRRGQSCRSEGAVTEQRVQRRLAAILAADVVGYSALMERDEEATYAEFERFKRELIEPGLSRHEGRLIKTTGDGALAEFASPLAAVRCAEGMVEEIITALSRFKSLFVIARNSSFTFKGRAVDVKEVGRRLGVRYVLEGSVRKDS